MKQYIFYQHSAQQFFIRHIEKYAGIIVPFSIAATFPATHAFLRALLAKDRKKEFALDPRSPLFQHNWFQHNWNREKKLREPHRKMAACLGGPFSSAGLKRKLEPEDMTKENVIEQVTRSCLSYQQKFRVLEEEQRKLDKYRKLLGIDSIPDINNPQRLIPPYFQFSGLQDRWYRITVKCIEIATSLIGHEQLSPVIHFESWQAIASWDAVVNAIAKVQLKSVFVYPNNFKEHEADIGALKSYIRSVQAFIAAGIIPTTLHGGYFAILLSKRGLHGFGNGVGYGEWRDSGYHRGGTAEKRIYIPKLHRFLDPAEAQALIAKEADYFTADSELLAGYFLAKKPVTEVTAAEALDHAMECRLQEILFLRSTAEATVLKELQETVEILKKVGQLEYEKYGIPLERWIEALRTVELKSPSIPV